MKINACKKAANSVSMLKKHSAGVIDAAIIIGFTALAVINLPYNTLLFLETYMPPECYILLLFILYRFVCIVFFNRTVGMKVASIYLINQVKVLTIKEKILAVFFVLLPDIYYVNNVS